MVFCRTSRRIGALAVRILAQRVDPLLRLRGIRIDRPEAGPNIRRGRADYEVARGVRRRRLPRAEHEVFPALALVRAGLAHVCHGVLPEIQHAAGVRPSRQIHDERTGTSEIDEADQIRRGGVSSQDAELVAIGVVDHDIAVLGAERVVVGALPLRHAHEREGPQIDLDRALELERIEERLQARLSGKAPFELERANAGIHGC